MSIKNVFVLFFGEAAAFSLLTLMTLPAAAAPARPAGPCDIYAAAHTPCVAAHSTTRALFASYNGPLYRVKRESDSRTLDIGVLPSTASDAGGYANAAAQDVFCARTVCVIDRIYDQSGNGNDLLQAGPGTFKGPAPGGFDTQPIADMAPITIGGHKAYGVYIIPGMGFRNNNARGIAINDEPEGIYYVIDGTHYDSGCCFDYGNSSTNGRAVGTGTMETTYFGTSTAWGSGSGPGPWIMADMEAGLFSGHGAKQNAADPTIASWRFVTAVVDGGGANRWDLRGGNAQHGGLTTFYSGERPGDPDDGRYYPMRKQGGILLGTGGDNGNGSSGTFYEGVMTTGYPSEATTDAVQANIVAAHYDLPRIQLSRVTAFTPGSTQQVTATFTNTTGAPINGLRINISGPSPQWKTVNSGSSPYIGDPIAPGARVRATFTVTSPAATGAGYLTANASWNSSPFVAIHAETATTRIRNVLPVKINEVGFGTPANPSNQFLELYNASDRAVDLSRWTLTATASQWPSEKLAAVPPGTSIPARGFYLLALANSGLAAPAHAGEKTIYVRNAAGFAAGQTIDVDGETRTIASTGSAASPMTTIFIPVSTGPRITIPAGSTRLPVTNSAGFAVGQKIAIDADDHGETATVTAVGKAATQTTLAARAAVGANTITLANESNITAGDTLTISTGARKEVLKVAGLNPGKGIALATPLRLDHAAGVDVSDEGTGIRFLPATRFAHSSADTVQPLGSGIVLDRPLARNHDRGAPVSDPQAAQTGYEGAPLPGQWFGAPLSAVAGSIALLDQRGDLVDAMIYGSQQSNSSGNGTIASPELAVLVGDQGGGGCIVAVSRSVGADGSSAGRYPDGADTGSNCRDFRVPSITTLAAAAAAGATNIKVAAVDGFSVGESVLISGAGTETATIASIGTPGATTTAAAVAAGATSIPVTNVPGFRPAQAIIVGEGADQETAVVAAARRGASTIAIESPLKNTHPAGTPVVGTGITLASPLTHAHAAGSQITDSLPTPGAANKYALVQ